VAAAVIPGACRGCGACLLTCPEHAFRPAPGGPRVATERCSGCGECLEVCPADAITLGGLPFPAALGGQQ
jgi:Pyruvate/2-oxoacid:ferredoxin oxidoreductase delta subunit